MDRTKVLKAIADETRMEILMLLLRHDHCVRALANELRLSEATVSQHLKVLREADLIIGERRGYFMHYAVERSALRALANEIEALAAMEREDCKANGRKDCPAAAPTECSAKGRCSQQVQAYCHGNRDDNQAAHAMMREGGA